MKTVDLIRGETFHGRKGAIANSFRYSVDYVLLDPDRARGPSLFSRNRRNLTAVHDTDYGGAPGKGRGTGGVRSHALLKGEDALLVAWVGAAPARANGLDGSPRELPTEYGKRDGSGEKLTGDITYLGSAGLN